MPSFFAEEPNKMSVSSAVARRDLGQVVLACLIAFSSPADAQIAGGSDGGSLIERPALSQSDPDRLVLGCEWAAGEKAAKRLPEV